MVKKVFVGVLLAAAFGLLVFGAVNRTMAKALDNEALALNDSVLDGYGGGHGNGNTLTYQNQVLDGGVDDTIAAGENLGAYGGYGPGDGTGNIVPPEDGTGYGIVNPNGGFGKQPEDAPRDGTHDGIADVSEWITVTGTVQSVSSYEVVITLNDGTTFELDGRELYFLNEIGLVLNVGDSVTILGFYDDGIFEVGQITTSSGTVVIREDDGTPLWTGGGVNTGTGRGAGYGGGGRR